MFLGKIIQHYGSGYVFKNNKYTTYFTGDTGYGNHFNEVYERFGDIDLLMLEDGQYDKFWSNIHYVTKRWYSSNERPTC